MGWYVVSCKAGQEEAFICFCKQKLSAGVLEDVFQFSYERMKKYLGEWHVDTCRMFPGHVFLQSDRPERLLKELGEHRAITENLEHGVQLLPVSPEEEAWMQSLCGKEHHLALSLGKIREDGRFRVLAGPLTGRESWIRKADLHKRVAVLKLKQPGGDREIWAGIDIGRKLD